MPQPLRPLRTIEEIVKATGRTREQLLESARTQEVRAIRFCCEHQRKIDDFCEQERQIQETLAHANLLEYTEQLSDDIDDWSEQLDHVKRQKSLTLEAFMDDLNSLRQKTTVRKKLEKEMKAAYDDKRVRNIPLSRDEAAAEAEFVVGEEYAVEELRAGMEGHFELINLALDSLSSVRARIAESCLSWIKD